MTSELVLCSKGVEINNKMSQLHQTTCLQLLYTNEKPCKATEAIIFIRNYRASTVIEYYDTFNNEASTYTITGKSPSGSGSEQRIYIANYCKERVYGILC